MDVIAQRLRNQKLTRPDARAPEAVVRWLTAVQAQDYAGARWAVGIRGVGIADRDVEQAFDEGRILRTHVMRPTWHFVAPADIRWLLSLTAPRVNAVSAFYYRKHELDAAAFTRIRRVLERVLEGGVYLTRAELAVALRRARLTPGPPASAGPRLSLMMMRAELDQVICSGPRRGRQFTYALLEERAPRAVTRSRDEALHELTQRYFTSHGPATVRDFVWWSGLTVRDARKGLEMAGKALGSEQIDGLTYWHASPAPRAAPPLRAAYLLPNYDEYLIAYKDRGLVAGPPAGEDDGVRRADPFAHHVIVDGRLAGSWTRTVRGNAVTLSIAPYRPFTPPETRAVAAAADRLGAFMNMPVVVE